MGIFLFTIVVSLAAFNLIFLLVKSKNRADQRKRFEEIDRFKAQQRALGKLPHPETEEENEADFSRLRKEKIHIWKE